MDRSFRLAVFLALVLPAGPAFCLSAGQVTTQSSAFLDRQLSLDSSLLSAAVSLVIPDTALFWRRTPTVVTQLSVGQVIAPLFLQKDPGDISLFTQGGTVYKKDYDSLTLDQASVLLALTPETTVVFDVSYLPSLSVGGQVQAMEKVGGYLAYRLSEASFSSLGFSVVAGYHWAKKQSIRSLDLTFDDGSGPVHLSGDLESSVAGHFAVAGLRLQKTLFFLNFYTELVGGLARTDGSARLEGSHPLTRTREGGQASLCLQGGFAIDLGNWKLGAGGGKDLLLESYSAQVSLVYEF